MKATGKMTKLMATESTCMQTVRDTKVSGKRTNNTGKVLKDGQMELSMMENTLKAKNMDEELFSGATTPCSLVSSRTIILKDTALINGTMEENIMVIGRTTKCMEKECSHGQTGGNTQDPIKKI